MTTDHFAQKAGTYEQNPKRVENVDNISNAILSTISLNPAMHIMDFGSGTGLLLERIAPHVAKITAVDVSKAMIEQLNGKLHRLPCAVEMLEVDLETAHLDHKFDGIISSMTLHHIRDIPAIFKKFHDLLKPGGFIALADLDSEDGSFHTPGTEGVHHHGFDRDALASVAQDAGFNHIQMTTASVLDRPNGAYPVFLLTATAS